MGEVAAAHVAGALSLQDAALLICRRSQLLAAATGGAMAVVELNWEEARCLLAGREDRLWLAASNSPRSSVLSGEPDAVEAVLSELRERSIFCQRVKVGVASHCPLVDGPAAQLFAELSSIQPQTPTVPLYSSVTGTAEPERLLDAAYWSANLREPVRFWPVLEQLRSEGHTVFLELSAHPVLLPAVAEGLGTAVTLISSLRRGVDEQAAMLGSLASLYVLGLPVRWDTLHPDGGHCLPFPDYPWQRESFWLETAPDTADARLRPPEVGHPLLGEPLELAAPAGARLWSFELGIDKLPYLADHRVLQRWCYLGRPTWKWPSLRPQTSSDVPRPQKTSKF